MNKSIENFPNYTINTNGIIMNTKFNKVIKGFIYKAKHTSYRRFGLLKDKKQHYLYLHRLLALTFIPNPNNYPNVDHKDGNGLNNNLDNLRWCPQSLNLQNQEVRKDNKSTGIKNIHYCSKDKLYRFAKIYNKILYRKHFKTKEEAIQCKNEWYKNNQDEFMVKDKRI